MGADKTATKILDIAERHVMQRGYHAFSYQHIADELDVKPAAVHYHFRTKSDLVAAVLDRYTGRWRRWTSALEGGPTEQLDAYIALSRDLLARNRIDPFGTLAGEHDHLPESVQQRLRALADAITGWFAALIASGREQGALSFDGPPDAKAAEIACALLGAQQLGRVCGADAFERVIAGVRSSLGVAP